MFKSIKSVDKKPTHIFNISRQINLIENSWNKNKCKTFILIKGFGFYSVAECQPVTETWVQKFQEYAILKKSMTMQLIKWKFRTAVMHFPGILNKVGRVFEEFKICSLMGTVFKFFFYFLLKNCWANLCENVCESLEFSDFATKFGSSLSSI